MNASSNRMQGCCYHTRILITPRYKSRTIHTRHCMASNPSVDHRRYTCLAHLKWFTPSRGTLQVVDLSWTQGINQGEEAYYLGQQGLTMNCFMTVCWVIAMSNFRFVARGFGVVPLVIWKMTRMRASNISWNSNGLHPWLLILWVSLCRLGVLKWAWTTSIIEQRLRCFLARLFYPQARLAYSSCVHLVCRDWGDGITTAPPN